MPIILATVSRVPRAPSWDPSALPALLPLHGLLSLAQGAPWLPQGASPGLHTICALLRGGGGWQGRKALPDGCSPFFPWCRSW